jgi:exodeoxyribonuclease V gamma subunit
LFDALTAGVNELPADPPAWLSRSGVLAEGAVGAQAYRQQRALLQPMLTQARNYFADGVARAATQAIDLDLGDGLRLTGSIDRVFHAADGGLMLFDAKPVGSAGLRDMLAAYIDWAALRLSSPEPLRAVLLTSTSGGKIAESTLLHPLVAADTDTLRAGLRRLIDLAQAAEHQPLLFFPKTALAYATSAPDQRVWRAAAAWQGSEFAGAGAGLDQNAPVQRQDLEYRRDLSAPAAGARPAGGTDPGDHVYRRGRARAARAAAPTAYRGGAPPARQRIDARRNRR